MHSKTDQTNHSNQRQSKKKRNTELDVGCCHVETTQKWWRNFRKFNLSTCRFLQFSTLPLYTIGRKSFAFYSNSHSERQLHLNVVSFEWARMGICEASRALIAYAYFIGNFSRVLFAFLSLSQPSPFASLSIWALSLHIHHVASPYPCMKRCESAFVCQI